MKKSLAFLGRHPYLSAGIALILGIGLFIFKKPIKFELISLMERGDYLVSRAFASMKSRSVEVIDIAPETGFQEAWLGHFTRTRALVAADFDLDGRVDFYAGNPGDESYIIRNTAGPDGKIRFELVQTFLEGELAWGASAADYDNDGDYDLFVAMGGNEGTGYNHLFKNMWMESGQTKLYFVDVTDTAGINKPVLAGFEAPPPVTNANGVWGDYDRDGDVDLFVSVNLTVLDLKNNRAGIPPMLLRNVLWRNNGDGTFTDVTDAVGLGASLRPTQHSTFLDIDNDGDLDLFENNFGDRNVLWRNTLVETGKASFVDVTKEFSRPPSEDLSFPIYSFASAAADFNQDGWQDLAVFMYGNGAESQSPYGIGHALFLNQNGKGFVNVAKQAEINNPYQRRRGTMGCQVGDLNGDGVPDLYMGNGGPRGGQRDQLYLSDSKVGDIPHYVNMSDLIDFPARRLPSYTGVFPSYPYRSHGLDFVDVDGDGLLEIAVGSGGPAKWPADNSREPDRLFKFVNWEKRPNYFKVRPVGNGTNVSLDAVGTRFALTVSHSGGTPWKLYNTLFAGSCFSAQNGFEVNFGLKDADTIHSLEIAWPDGTHETITQGLVVNSSIVIKYGTGQVTPLETAKLDKK